MNVNEYPKVLYAGTQANYDAIATKDSTVLYWTTDTNKIYKGNVDFSKNVEYLASKPTTVATRAANRVYMFADTGNVEFYDGTNWHVISLPSTTSFEYATADDLHVPTTKAVKDYVEAIIGGSSDVVADVSATTAADSSVTGYVDRGGVTVTQGDDSKKVIQVPGVATTISASATNAAGLVLAHTTGNDDTVVVPDVLVGVTGSTGTAATLDFSISDDASGVSVTVPGVVTGLTGATGTDVEGQIAVTTSTGTHANVTVPGVFKSVSWNSTTRTLTFTDTSGNSTGTDHVVDLGKDIFIDQDADNRYENGNLYLYLNDGDGSSDPTEIVIPVTGLITDYFGDDTSSVSVDVDNNTHKVTAAVIRRPDETGFENRLKLSSTVGKVGLYVDTSDIEQNITNLGAAITWGTF